MNREEDEVFCDEEEPYPCDDCDAICDGWDAYFCCRLCGYYGVEHCDNCDPWDI